MLSLAHQRALHGNTQRLARPSQLLVELDLLVGVQAPFVPRAIAIRDARWRSAWVCAFVVLIEIPVPVAFATAEAHRERLAVIDTIVHPRLDGRREPTRVLVHGFLAENEL